MRVISLSRQLVIRSSMRLISAMASENACLALGGSSTPKPLFESSIHRRFGAASTEVRRACAELEWSGDRLPPLDRAAHIGPPIDGPGELAARTHAERCVPRDSDPERRGRSRYGGGRGPNGRDGRCLVQHAVPRQLRSGSAVRARLGTELNPPAPAAMYAGGPRATSTIRAWPTTRTAKRTSMDADAATPRVNDGDTDDLALRTIVHARRNQYIASSVGCQREG